jgi:MOSC domain-containing protein YiiM
MTQDIVELHAPFESDTLLQIRTGKLKPLKGLSILSGIDKDLRTGAISVSSTGLDADEHDYTFHGGREKAIHACT